MRAGEASIIDLPSGKHRPLQGSLTLAGTGSVEGIGLGGGVEAEAPHYLLCSTHPTAATAGNGWTNMVHRLITKWLDTSVTD
jgi:hypothetical protein